MPKHPRLFVYASGRFSLSSSTKNVRREDGIIGYEPALICSLRSSSFCRILSASLPSAGVGW